MNKICVVTTNRSDYGLLKNIIKRISLDDELDLFLVAAGSHLSVSTGMTVNEIEEDGFPISARVEYLLDSDNELSVIKGSALAMISFGELLKRERPDMLAVLGDRYELLPICYCAVNLHIPIAHISGGEITEGAIDDCIRHCITKMSYLHFPACEAYRRRIIQLGESPERVFNMGDVGVENIQNMKFLSKSHLERELGFLLDSAYFGVTFHPVTLETDSTEEQMEQLLSAISDFPDYKFVFTYANADSHGRIINRKIHEFVKTHPNCIVCKSLGVMRYLSLLKYSSGVIGNSSSGIVEAPSIGIPTVNIGDRQKGRLQAESIINCECSADQIKKAMIKSQTEEFKAIVKNSINPYGADQTSWKIVAAIKSFLNEKTIDRKKKFYDINFEVKE